MLLLASTLVSAADDTVAEARAAIDRDDYPAAILVLEQRLAGYPGDEEARYLLARTLAWSRRWDAAMAEYDQLLDQSPDNADYLLGKSQVYVWSERPAEALPLLERARALAPDYEGIWRLESQALLATGGAENRRRHDALAAEARKRFPDSNWPLWQDLSGSALGFEPSSDYEVGYSFDSLDNGFDNWHSVYVQASHNPAPRKAYYVVIESIDRFSERESDFMAGAYLPLDQDWTLLVQGSVAPSANVLPEWTASAELQRSLAGSWGLRGGFRHAEYSDSRYELMNLGAERYWGNWQAAYTLYIGWPESAGTSISHLGRLDRYYGARNRIGLLAGFGEESESVGQDRLLTSNTRTLGLTGRHWMNPDWAVSWDVIWHRQGDVYNRGGVRVGLRRQL
jgi:YaiO family outer membrane protein